MKKIKSESKRITYIDTAKCIAIILMVLGHILMFYRDNGNSHSQLLVIIYTFHVAAFFIFTGILFNTKKWMKEPAKKFILSRAKTLIIPYLFFDITMGFVNCILHKTLTLEGIINVILKTFSFNPNIGPNWFLITIFISNIIFYYFIKYHKEYFKYIALIPILIISYNPLNTIDLIIFLSRGIIGFSFIYLGYTLKEYYLYNQNKRWDIIIISFVLLVSIAGWNGQIDLWSCTINNPIYMVIGGLIGTYLIIGIAKHIDNKLFQYIGQNTIIILATHSILIKPLHTLFKLEYSNKSLVFLLIMIIIIELPIIYICNKYFPKLVGKYKEKKR